MLSRKIHVLGSIACATLIVLSASTVAEEKDGLIATVNGNKITASMLQEYQRSRGFIENISRKQQTQMMIEELINRELIYQDAIKNGIDKNPDVLKQIEILQKNVIAGAMLRNVTQASAISDEELKKEYELRKKDLATPEYKVRHILVEKEDEAKAIIKELDKGGKFADIAKAKSTDPSATHGGDLDWVKPGEMVGPFSEAIEKLKNKEYTKTPVKTDFGWHVILREDSREVPPPSFEQMREQLRIRVQNLQIEQYIGSLRNSAKIERTHSPN